jgi:hypothetical protein
MVFFFINNVAGSLLTIALSRTVPVPTVQFLVPIPRMYGTGTFYSTEVSPVSKLFISVFIV